MTAPAGDWRWARGDRPHLESVSEGGAVDARCGGDPLVARCRSAFPSQRAGIRLFVPSGDGIAARQSTKSIVIDWNETTR